MRPKLPPSLSPALAAVFAAQFVALDVALRGAGSYVGSPRRAFAAMASVGLWALLGSLAGSRAWRVVVAVLAGGLVATDVLVARYYGVPLDARVVRAALHGWDDVRPVIIAGILPVIGTVAVAIGAEALCLTGAARGPRRVRWPWGLVFAVGLVGAPLEDATPDLRAFVAMGALRPAREARAEGAWSAPAAEITSARRALPNVLVVITESVGASSYGSTAGSDAARMFNPEIDALLPDRVGLESMRALASYTELSVSAIVTGAPPALEPRAPDLFARVRAVRSAAGVRPTVAYWSAQSRRVLERADLPSEVDSLVTLETLVGAEVGDEDDLVERGVDRLLAARAVAAIPALPAPYVAVLHLAGTHAPYFVDDARAPFRPYTHAVAWSGMDALRRAYQDAIVAQDATLATVVRAFQAAQGGAPWAIVFTSDHGEAFGEHGAIHHGQSLYEEQIHVPAWIAWGNGALRDDEARALRLRAREPATHVDLVPTLLDLYGVWGAPELDRASLAGTSLLRARDAARGAAPLPITNCTSFFPCPLATWGVLAGDDALVAQAWDGAWRCVHLPTDAPLDPASAGCARMAEASRRFFPSRPNGDANR